MTHTMRRLALLGACLGLTALAGCTAGTAQPAVSTAQPAASATRSPAGQASAVASQPATPASPAPVPTDVNVAAFRALAEREAKAWPGSPLGKAWKAGLVIPSAADLTSAGGPRGFPSQDVREAFGNGNLVYTGPPPSRYGPRAVVTWPDSGATLKVPVLSEAQTFVALQHNALGGGCSNCSTRTLEVTNAQPGSIFIPTNRGGAIVPAWQFAIPALGGEASQAALAPGSYLTADSVRPAAQDLGPLGKAFVGAAMAHAVTPDGRTLDMWLGNNPCSPPAKYGGLVAEVGDVVVIGGWTQDPHPVTGSCTPTVYGQEVSVRLAAPLGDRVILDAATGTAAPYPFHPAPPAAK